MAVFHGEKKQQSGIALGGIGTGSVELHPDGEFHFWQIANQSRWGGQCDQSQMDDGEQHTGALSFYARCKTGNGRVILRKLGMKTDAGDFTYRMFAWNKPVKAIEYDGSFPACTLDYIDDGLPVKIRMKAVSPFVPHESDISSTPGFILDFDICAEEDTEFSLCGMLEPSFANKRRCRNMATAKEGFAAVSIYPRSADSDPDTGDITLSVSGNAELSRITAEYFRFMREFVSHSEFGITQESFLFSFRERGTLPETAAGEAPDPLPEDLNALSDGEIDRFCAERSSFPLSLSFFEKMRRIDSRYPADREQKLSFLRYYARQIRDIGEDFGSCALCGRVNLKKGEKTSLRFVLSWFFPNHFGRYGNMMGHYYENLYKNSLEANIRLSEDRSISQRANEFASLLRIAERPLYLGDALSVHLSALVKDSWRIKDGRFGLWEGLGSCGFHTTDITYHASFGLINIFPDLQLSQMRNGARFQREDGRVHHFLTPDLDHDDNGFDRVDMNPQFVLMVARDYLFTGDRSYLSDMWKNVKAAMESTSLLDTDGDGLPDSGTGRNTYDAWRFSGAPAYISILWIAALKAAAFIARCVGESEMQEKYSALFEKAKGSLEALLWNGKYYDLWRERERRDGALMSDQLDGEWFLRTCGLDGFLPDARVRAVLSYIFEHNFDPDNGLINASCPDGEDVSVFTYKNCQADAVWTGIGYAFSALSIELGLDRYAEQIVDQIHENQSRLGLFWSHWECGAYYTRPMSSWSLLIALCGMKIDAENKTLSLDPKINGVLPLITPFFTGKMTVSGGECVIEIDRGAAEEWKIRAGERRIIIRDKETGK